MLERREGRPIADPAVDPRELRVDRRGVATELLCFAEQHGADLQFSSRGEKVAQRAACGGFAHRRGARGEEELLGVTKAALGDGYFGCGRSGRANVLRRKTPGAGQREDEGDRHCGRPVHLL